MTPYEVAQLICYGEANPDWRHVTMVAVIWAESGGDPHAVGMNEADPDADPPKPASVDRGLFQITDYDADGDWEPDWHPVTNFEAFTPGLAWPYIATQITTPGVWSWDFGIFNTYKEGIHLRHMSLARDGVNQVRDDMGLPAL